MSRPEIGNLRRLVGGQSTKPDGRAFQETLEAVETVGEGSSDFGA